MTRRHYRISRREIRSLVRVWRHFGDEDDLTAAEDAIWDERHGGWLAANGDIERLPGPAIQSWLESLDAPDPWLDP